MLMNKDASHPDFGHLKGIEGHVESAAVLTRQLLGFARGGKYEVKTTDLNELIKNSVKHPVETCCASSISSTGRSSVDWQWFFHRVRSALNPP